MYQVALGSAKPVTSPSYSAAVAAAKTSGNALADALALRSTTVAASNLYRSPKARARVAGDLGRQSQNVRTAVAAAKFPRLAGDVSLKLGNIPLAITKV